MMRYLTNSLFLFIAVWTVAGVSYVLGVCFGLFPDIELGAAGAVLLNVLAFVLGYCTWMLFKRMTPVPEETCALSLVPLHRDQVRRLLGFTFLMGLAALALGLYRVAVIASYFDTSFVKLLTHPAILRIKLVLFIKASLSRIDYIPMLLSLTSSFFAIGFVLLGVFLYVDDTRAKHVYLGGFLTIALAIGLTNLSRYEMTVDILYLVFSYGLMCASKACKSRKQAFFDIVWPLTAVAVLFVAIDILLAKGSAYGQLDRFRGFFFSFYWYIASPLAAFNEFITNFDGQHSFGQNMFFSFYKWLHRFNWVPEPHVLFYGEKTYLPYLTNVYTYLRTVYEDFGILGVAIVPYLLGWLTCAIRSRACRNLAFLNLYVVLLVLILLSFYNYYLMSNQVYLQIFFGFVFFRRDLGSLCPDAECISMASGT